MGKKVDKISIITVDPYIPRIYKYAKGSFNQLKSIKASKNDFIIGYVANKDLIIETLDIGANIPPEDVADAIENKAYEELKLDPAIEYNITFTRAYGEGGNLYQVFISDKNSLAKLYSPIKKRVSFIDVVAPAPLLFEILYKDTTIPVGNIDLFIIFGEYDTFLTFYKGGKYLYSKSIPYSLDDLYYRFCELAGEAIVKKDEFKKILSTEGLKVDNDRYKELLVKIFNECFLSINDVLIYTKRAYEIKKIDNCYVGIQWDNIKGIDSYIINYLGLEPQFLDFPAIKGIKSDDLIMNLLLRNGLALLENRVELINLTPYPRPPALYKRPSGQFLLALVVAVLLVLLYPIGYLAAAYWNKLEILKLEKKENKLRKRVNYYKENIRRRNEQLKKLEARYDEYKKDFDKKWSQFKVVYDKKVNYRMKSDQLALLSEDLFKYQVETNLIKTLDNKFTLHLLGNSEQNITELIKYITNKYKNDLMLIDINKIYHDKNNSKYEGILNVIFKKEKE